MKRLVELQGTLVVENVVWRPLISPGPAAPGSWQSQKVLLLSCQAAKSGNSKEQVGSGGRGIMESRDG